MTSRALPCDHGGDWTRTRRINTTGDILVLVAAAAAAARVTKKSSETRPYCHETRFEIRRAIARAALIGWSPIAETNPFFLLFSHSWPEDFNFDRFNENEPENLFHSAVSSMDGSVTFFNYFLWYRSNFTINLNSLMIHTDIFNEIVFEMAVQTSNCYR